MLEKSFPFAKDDTKNVEKLIDDDHVLINHMILPQGTGLPEHFANAHVYMIVVRGAVSLQLDDQPVHRYESGHIINIPYHTKMNVNNLDEAVLEFFVVKAPHPRTFEVK